MILVLFICAIFLPYFQCKPVDVPPSYQKLFSESACKNPFSVLQEKFEDLNPNSTFSSIFLGPLEACKVPGDRFVYKLCDEVFAVLFNISTCNTNFPKQDLDIKLPNLVGSSSKICSDFQNEDFDGIQDSKYVSSGFKGSAVCDLFCGSQNIHICDILLWGYKIQNMLLGENIDDKYMPSNAASTPVGKSTKDSTVIESNHKLSSVPMFKSTVDNLSVNNTTFIPKAKDSKSTIKSQEQFMSTGKTSIVLQSSITNKVETTKSSKKVQVTDYTTNSPGQNSNAEIEQISSSTMDETSLGINDTKNSLTSEKNESALAANNNLTPTTESNILADGNIGDPNSPVTLDSTPTDSVNAMNVQNNNDQPSIYGNDSEEEEADIKKAAVGNSKPLIPSTGIKTDSDSNLDTTKTELNTITESKSQQVASHVNTLNTAFEPSELSRTQPPNLDQLTIPVSVPEEPEPPTDEEPSGFDDQDKPTKVNVISEDAKSSFVDYGLPLDDGIETQKFGSPGSKLPDSTFEQEDNHFFFYFLSMVAIVIACYLIFHNKQKIMALIVEGCHERRRRPHGVNYRKLETK